jgi:hypothetical protein
VYGKVLDVEVEIVVGAQADDSLGAHGGSSRTEGEMVWKTSGFGSMLVDTVASRGGVRLTY